MAQGLSQDLVSGGEASPIRGGGGRPPIIRLRPQITGVPPYVLLATPGFRGGGAGYAPAMTPSTRVHRHIPSSSLSLLFSATRSYQLTVRNKVTRVMCVEAPRQFLQNVRSSGLACEVSTA